MSHKGKKSGKQNKNDMFTPVVRNTAMRHTSSPNAEGCALMGPENRKANNSVQAGLLTRVQLVCNT